MSKKFSDFLNQLTDEKVAEIIDKTNEVLKSSQESLQEDPNSFFGNQIATISLFVNLGLLEEYHEWLER